MKKTATVIFIFVLLSLLFIPSIQAQQPATSIETLILDIWPDYDEPSVLVLMTGTLPTDTSLPAAVTIPLSPDAEVNAVARITGDNQMIDDITFTITDNEITFITPDPRFRVEYYAPYESNGINHAFSFNWLADIPVDGMLAAVQQPTGATNMNVTPESANVVTDSTDGFTYYTFPPETIPAGENFNIAFEYDMAVPQLSIENRPVVNSAAEANSNSTTSNTSSTSFSSLSLENNSWLWILGLISVALLAVVITWQVATRKAQPRRKNHKPRPKRTSSFTKPTGNARYCHECGNKLNANDKFCRECGTAVKSNYSKES